MKKTIMLCACLCLCGGLAAQQTDTVKTSTLGEVSIQAQAEGLRRIGGAENGLHIGQGELFRAACCNLGESFVTNPSVDVNYNDAAVGARQIKLLGLSGQYVQMLTEGQPASTGATLPYSLGYVPGAWLKSISVSKGASSVKNGPQSITGQINVEYLKPEDDPAVSLNLYGDSQLKTELNAAVGRHLNHHLSTILMVHGEEDFGHHDDNGDHWLDAPAVRQLHVMNRWKYTHGRYIMHAGAGYLQERRQGGQVDHMANPFRIRLDARRAEAYMKHAFLLNQEHNTNIALLANGSLYRLDGTFGPKAYAGDQLNFSSQLVLEHDFSDAHNLSTGLSLNVDRPDEQLSIPHSSLLTQEYTPGLYAQYTFKPSYRFTAMGGIRLDHSTLYERTYATPRLHLKWLPTERLTLRASVGKGYRTPHALAESHYLLASGRTLELDSLLPQEEAWNTGFSATLHLPVGERDVQLSAEYYYTNFLHQAVVDYEDPLYLRIHDLDGRSFSHTLQVDAACDITDELNILAALRLNHVRCTYDGELLEKPLQSRYKGLLTVGWKPMMGIWQVDLTLALNGGGRMPKAYTLADGSASWDDEFPTYPQVNLQVTREFRHFSLYVGGENLTNYRQPQPVIAADAPYSAAFEPTLIWGPVHGIMAYAGLRASF